MQQNYYFEDFEIGTCDQFGHYEVTREEILEFAGKYDPQPFHLSEEAGQAMHFGGLCASGWHTGAMVMRMVVDNMPPGGSGSLGRRDSTNCAGPDRYFQAIHSELRAP